MSENILNMPIESLELSVRAYSCLKRGGYYTVGKLVEATADELHMLPSLGKKSFAEIVNKLDSLGLCLKQSSDKMIEAKSTSKMHEEPQVEKWVVLEDVMEHLGISRSSVHAFIKKGKIPAYKIREKYRFKISEIDEWVRAGRMKDD